MQRFILSIQEVEIADLSRFKFYNLKNGHAVKSFVLVSDI